MTNKPTLPQIAARIRALESNNEKHEKNIIANVIAIGQLLAEAKGRCEHGEYGDWIAKEFPSWPQRTLRRYHAAFCFAQNGHAGHYGQKIDVKKLNFSLTGLYEAAALDPDDDVDLIKAVIVAATEGRVTGTRAREIISNYESAADDQAGPVEPDPKPAPVEPELSPDTADDAADADDDQDDGGEPDVKPLPLLPDDQIGNALHVLANCANPTEAARTLTPVQIRRLIDALEAAYEKMTGGDPVKMTADRAEAKSRTTH
jgi:hypothetical protein